MDYRRVFRTCLGVAGTLESARFAPVLLDTVGLRSVTPTLAAAVSVGVGAFGVAFPERAGGPERPGTLLYTAVVSVLLPTAVDVGAG